MKDNNENEESSYIQYWDNVWIMSQKLPLNHFA